MVQLPSGVWAPREYERVPLSPAVHAAKAARSVLAGDSILVTPGSGATVATHTVGSKEHQVVMVADHEGHIHGSKDDWFVWFTPATNAANRSVGDLFNADASVIVRVRGVWVIPTVTAITGVNIEYILNFTNTVGTGGTTITPRPLDPNFAALDADITARAGATGGAGLAYEFFRQYHFNEETNAGLMLMQHQNLIPTSIGGRVAEVVLRQNDGLQVKQGGAGTVGLTGALFYFTVE
jgi:hypothetical protein